MNPVDSEIKLILDFISLILNNVKICLEYFQSKHELEELKALCNDGNKEVERIKEKLNGDFCISIMGMTSCGKSTTINALLKREVLPSGLGRTTLTDINIKGSSEDYISYDLQNLSLTEERIVEVVKESKDTVKLFLQSIDSELLPMKVTYVDTPGFELDLTSEMLTQVYDKSNYVIICFSVKDGVSEIISKFLRKKTNNFHRFNGCIVFTHSDKINQLNEGVKCNMVKESKKLLMDLGNISEIDAEGLIYFISPKIFLKALQKKAKDIKLERKEEVLIEEFSKFSISIKDVIRNSNQNSENFENELIKIASNIYSKTTSTNMCIRKEIDDSIQKIKTYVESNKDDIIKKIKFIFQKRLVILNEEVKQCIDPSFTTENAEEKISQYLDKAFSESINTVTEWLSQNGLKGVWVIVKNLLMKRDRSIKQIQGDAELTTITINADRLNALNERENATGGEVKRMLIKWIFGIMELSTLPISFVLNKNVLSLSPQSKKTKYTKDILNGLKEMWNTLTAFSLNFFENFDQSTEEAIKMSFPLLNMEEELKKDLMTIKSLLEKSHNRKNAIILDSLKMSP